MFYTLFQNLSRATMEKALNARSMHSLLHEIQVNTERALNVRNTNKISPDFGTLLQDHSRVTRREH